MFYLREFIVAPPPRRNQLQCHLNVLYCSTISAGGPRFPRMVRRAYSSWAMCVHDGSAPRGACASADRSYAADLNRCHISRADLLHRRCILWVADVVWMRTRRGPSVSATSAFPRSMRLRVVGPQFPILGLGNPLDIIVRARPARPMARWVIATNTHTHFIPILGAISW